jgi:CMP-N-acetylneuraminic acid synthetase
MEYLIEGFKKGFPLNFALIPARSGSQRLAEKNHLDICGISLVDYSLQLAISSGKFDQVFLNSDSKSFEKYALKNSAKFHLRPQILGSSETRIDEVIYEFLVSHPDCKNLFLINPPSQLLKVKDVEDAMLFFETESLDSLITSTKMYRHAFMDSRPLNFDIKQALSPTQDLEPIEILNYSIMGWKSESFIKSFQESAAGLMCGNFKTFENGITNLLAIKTEEDFDIQKILRESGQFGER